MMTFKNKKDSNVLLEKAYKAKEHVDELLECLEATIAEMEYDYGVENYRHDGYRKDSRYDYMRRMR
ncbi:MAG: hypothetical protein IJ180_08785 [Bacteroidales bacterium]|nr:hypothetical protein [Bacteroidales bacterium]